MRLRASFALMAVFPLLAHAHGGGLNSEGCHTNRRTGDYHCHRSSYSPPPPTNVQYAPQQRLSAPNPAPASAYSAQQATPRPFMPAHNGSQSVNSLSQSAGTHSNSNASAQHQPAHATRPFANCAAARAAGAAPVYRGEPGYGPHLDRDNDGIGCEPYRGR